MGMSRDDRESFLSQDYRLIETEPYPSDCYLARGNAVFFSLPLDDEIEFNVSRSIEGWFCPIFNLSNNTIDFEFTELEVLRLEGDREGGVIERRDKWMADYRVAIGIELEYGVPIMPTSCDMASSGVLKFKIGE